MDAVKAQVIRASVREVLHDAKRHGRVNQYNVLAAHWYRQAAKRYLEAAEMVERAEKLEGKHGRETE
jgi:superfamily I DNA/RNA helicase